MGGGHYMRPPPDGVILRPPPVRVLMQFSVFEDKTRTSKMQLDLFPSLVPFQSYDDGGITFQHSLVE